MHFLILALITLVPALPPASGERFRATPTWLATERVVWDEAATSGATKEERRLLLSIAWNESRGRHAAIGDHGCAWGVFQIQLGGVGMRGRCAADSYKVLGPEFQVQRGAFLEPRLSTRAALALLRRLGSQRYPDIALVQYAGCNPGGKCAEKLLGRHRWWKETGLETRWLTLEHQDRR